MQHPQRFLVPLFIFISIIIGINPYDRATWLLENMMTLFFAIFVFFQQRRHPFSAASWWMIFGFGTLHVIGSHYTYSLVPYNDWSNAVMGVRLNDLLGWERNHFDRLVHLFYGLLLFLPIREVMNNRAGLQGNAASYFTLEFVMASSLIYELVEWGAAVTFGGDVGMAYLGTQGDIWDAHKDMALAALGALVSWLILAFSADRLRNQERKKVLR